MTSMFDTDDFRRGRLLVRAARLRGLAGPGRDPNVVGSGFGQRVAAGRGTGEPALVVFVIRKVSEQFIPPSRLLPRRVYVGRTALEVDVVETGPFYPFAFTARERPAPNGISIAHIAVTAGTLGSLVLDNTDGTTCILSNNHVLANQNAGTPGDVVTQPGPFDGGTTPADDIATLKRFVTINATGNVVDAAIAQPNNKADVVDQVKDNLIPVATPDHPAVGLLFAGSCNRTLINPIDEVLRQLDIRFLASGNVTVAADVGMNVEKVGRTTEYTTSTVTEIDVEVDIPYDFGPAGFVRQIATAWMSEGGDSGSLVYRGGEGGNEDHCTGGCASAAAANRLLGGIDLELDTAVEKEFRTRYLQQTRIGRWAVELFFANEQRLVRRSQDVRLDAEDRAFARYLYDKYADTVRATMLQPFRSQLRLTSEHLSEMRDVLGRARQWLSASEVQVAEELLQLAYEFEGRSAAEVLERLNDEELFRRVRSLAARLEFLTLPDVPDRRPDEG